MLTDRIWEERIWPSYFRLESEYRYRNRRIISGNRVVIILTNYRTHSLVLRGIGGIRIFLKLKEIDWWNFKALKCENHGLLENDFFGECFFGECDCNPCLVGLVKLDRFFNEYTQRKINKMTVIISLDSSNEVYNYNTVLWLFKWYFFLSLRLPSGRVGDF